MTESKKDVKPEAKKLVVKVTEWLVARKPDHTKKVAVKGKNIGKEYSAPNPDNTIGYTLKIGDKEYIGTPNQSGKLALGYIDIVGDNFRVCSKGKMNGVPKLHLQGFKDGKSVSFEALHLMKIVLDKDGKVTDPKYAKVLADSIKERPASSSKAMTPEQKEKTRIEKATALRTALGINLK